MKRFPLLFLMLILIASACQSVATPADLATPRSDSVTEASVPTSALSAAPTETASPIPSSTATSIPVGLIQVDTLEQEVYPFAENGQCSLAEAIFAANSGKPKDSCAAGDPGKSIIELMPGEYHLTQRDQTPPQVEWLISVLSVGDAFPPILFPLTIHGNGAILTRDEGAEPFRFFEVMVNSKLILDNITLQGGDVGEDWGGAINASSAVVELDNVHFINNRAENGGAIYLDLSGLTAKNSEFKDNFATGDGGALFISSSKANIQGTRLETNQADGEGGGLYADFVTLVLKDSFFLGNRVTGTGLGTRGGGIYANHVNLTVTDSQFYQNEAPRYGGAIIINNPILAGIDPEDGDPMEPLQQSPMVTDFLTSIPGFQATLEAHPSGIYVEFHEDAQIHNNCFANNITLDPQDPNWTSGLLGRASVADGNYWGDPSGPSGMGPGTGDSVGKRLTFEPFLTEAPAFCNGTLSEKSDQ